MRWVLLVCFIFMVDYTNASLTGDVEEAFVAGTPQMIEVVVDPVIPPKETALFSNNENPYVDELSKLSRKKEAYVKQKEKVALMRQNLDESDGAVQHDKLKRRVCYFRLSSVCEVIGSLLIAGGSATGTIGKLAGAGDVVVYVGSGMGAAGLAIERYGVKLKNDAVKLRTEALKALEREEIEQARLEEIFHKERLLYDLTYIKEKEKNNLAVRLAEVQSQRPPVKRVLRKRAVKKKVSPPKETDPLLQGPKGKEEEK